MSHPQSQQGPAALYRHNHPPIRNINDVAASSTSLGQKVADGVAAVVGSWPFIIVQSILLGFWLVMNVYLAYMVGTHPGFLKAWDPYPFILLNLVLSFQAAYTGPVVMMSQNRQSEKDRLNAQCDYEVNKKSEEEIEVIMKHLVHQDKLLLDAIARIEALRAIEADRPATERIDDLLKRMDLNDKNVVALLERMNPGTGASEATHG